jgi:hypothetical protein
VREIERLIRSAAWDAATRRAFFAHLDRGRNDSARLRYCERKAWFMLRSGNKTTLRAAEKLLDGALQRFVGADKATCGLARGTRAEIREALGNFAGAAEDSRRSAVEMPSQATPAVHVARALLRRDGMVATREVLALERQVLRDPHAHLLRSSAVWTEIVAACCAAARKKPRSARIHASRALDAAFGDAPAFEAWLRRKKRLSLAEPDLKPSEITTLAQLAGRSIR